LRPSERMVEVILELVILWQAQQVAVLKNNFQNHHQLCGTRFPGNWRYERAASSQTKNSQ
jgi:hypothetical protein